MDFSEHPGLIYVVVTLLPLASFVLLFLLGGLRQYLRTYRESNFGENLYQMLGGDLPPKWPAYVALGAIGISCVLSLVGFIWFFAEHHESDKHVGLTAKIKSSRDTVAHLQHEIAHEHDPKKEAEKREELKKAEEELHRLESRWSQRIRWAWLKLPTLQDDESGTSLELGYYIDSLSATMFLMVTFIATLIHCFSIGYMKDEQDQMVEDHQVHGEGGAHFKRRGRFGRFFMFLSLFCFSMLNLILADNLFQVFISWELVGICSFLLIGFYYERTSASNASNKAFITNRVGDAGFIIGLLIVFTYFGTFNFQDLFSRVRAPLTDSEGHSLQLGGQIVRGGEIEDYVGDPGVRIAKTGPNVVIMPRELGDLHAEFYDEGTMTEAAVRSPKGKTSSMPYWLLVVAGLGIFLGCVGKSAQFPLHVWLPDAMEGPTPVSALIHAATMVAAGVYLVGRCYPLFPPETLLVVAYTGAITLFVAASIAVVMTDIKKVLAYSTVSQLGYMMLALGIGGWAAGLFHLLTHAFFKALLFLGSGSVIYGCHHEQEMTKMGGLFPKMKITALTMLVGVLAIAGIPLFSGWYSKDAILAQAAGFAWEHPKHLLLFVLPLATAGITTFYMFRMWFMTFTGKPRDHHVYEHAHESPYWMTVPLMLLAACSIFVAWGLPPWNAENSALEHFLKHSQPVSVEADFGVAHAHDDHDRDEKESASGEEESEDEHGHKHGHSDGVRSDSKVNEYAHEQHASAGYLALIAVVFGIVFAAAVYYYKILDPADAKEQFPGVHAFLAHKWYFDELYSALLVRPALVVAGWCKAFDANVIDGIVHRIAAITVWTSYVDGAIDRYIVDGLVNVLGDSVYSLGGKLRSVQTGYLRSYILFLALAVVAVFIVLAYFVAMVKAG